MKKFDVTRRHALGAFGALAAVPLFARAQTWPSQPLRLIVGFTAGSSPDMMARLLAEPLAERLRTTVVVDNRPGAAGNIGAEAVASATDGHTIGLMPNGPLTTSPLLYSKLRYSTASFAPVSIVGSAPLLLVCSRKVAAPTVAEFLARARASAGKWNFGSVGTGSAGHLAVEVLQGKVGFTATHVPYAGAPQVLTALVAGDIELAVLPLGPTLPLVRDGRVTGVAVTAQTRSTLAPEFPSMAESGIAGMQVEVWNAVVAPAKWPAAQVQRLAREVSEIMRTEAVRTKLFAQGWRAEGTAPEALVSRMRDDAALYGQIIRERGIKLD